MVKKIIIILSALIIAALIIGCSQDASDNDAGTDGQIPTPDTREPPIEDTATTGDIQGGEQVIGTHTLKEVAGHDSEDDCWIAINGKVYDVTEFVGPHPGGAALLEGCGIDGSDLYETRPMGSGTPHPSKARQMLDDYYIGDLS
jgi:cytochrome b involved in lipid metabolism